MGVSDSAARIDVAIEELRLDGFAVGDHFRIADAVKRELTRLITEQGLGGRASQPAKDSARDLPLQHSRVEPLGGRSTVASLDAGSCSIPPGASATTIGDRVGRAVHESLSGKTR